MKVHSKRVHLALLVLLISGLLSPVSTYADSPQGCAQLLSSEQNGVRAITSLGANLAAAAALNGFTQEKFREVLEKDSSYWLDRCGRVFFVDEAPKNISSTSSSPAATVAYDQTFLLHSKPGSLKTIYLDFNGHSFTGTAWNSYFRVSSPYFASGYSKDADFSNFSTSDMDEIQSVWQRVAEDYAPFDVDVTTQEPAVGILERSSTSDNIYGTRAVVTADAAMQRVCGCGGVAYVGVFDLAGSSHETYQPAWVFAGVGTGAKNITEALTHEVGHNLGLNHDGTSTLGYYQGSAGWAPIMGVGYYEGLTQWSKGQYPGANNKEDDYLVIASHGAILRSDEDSNNTSTARSLSSSLAGIISSPTDKDWFVLTPGSSGNVTISADVGSISPNLDIKLDLYSASDLVNPIATSNPAMIDSSTDVIGGLSASITFPVTAGNIYYAVVDGVGFGDLATTGYSDYGSVGNYTISISGSTSVLTVTTSSLPNANAGSNYSYQLSASAGTPPYVWSASSLPSWLTLSSSGLLTGTAPSSSSNSTFTVTVTDSVTTASKDLGINVIVPALTITTTSLPNGSNRKSYAASLSASGGVGPYTWTRTSGTLPTGLTLNSTGTIIGTPTKRGTFTFSVKVTDAIAGFIAKQFTIKII